MKQNHYILFPSLPYFAFKLLASMNERKAFSQGIISVLHVFIYAFNTAITSGTLQSTQEFPNLIYTNNRIISFESYSSAVIGFFSSGIITYRIEKTNALIIISVFLLIAFIASSVLHAFQLIWLVSVLGVAAFLISGALYLLKSNFTETKF